MSSFMNKLNVLVKSSLHGVLSDDVRRSPRQMRLGKGIDQQIAALRRQIDDALNDEDRMTADLQALQAQIDEWDRQADQAVGRGDEATARHAVRQMQLQQQRRAMVQADLDQHRYSTSELIQRVNELEAVVAEARRQSSTLETEDDEAEGESLSARLRGAMQQAGPRPATPPEVKSTMPISDQAVEDDLARRRARLSQ